jgi:large subunit ribosomal protein L23
MEIVLRPLVTEKVTKMNEKGTYGFVVAKKANKIQIKLYVEKTYGVNVQSVRTLIVAGKAKSRNSKSKVLTGSTSAYKKAFVTVATGEVIDFYSGL